MFLPNTAECAGRWRHCSVRERRLGTSMDSQGEVVVDAVVFTQTQLYLRRRSCNASLTMPSFVTGLVEALSHSSLSSCQQSGHTIASEKLGQPWVMRLRVEHAN